MFALFAWVGAYIEGGREETILSRKQEAQAEI